MGEVVAVELLCLMARAVELLCLVAVERGSTNNKDTDCNHRKLWMAEGKIHRCENSKTPE